MIKTSPKLTEDSFDSVEGDVPKLVTRRAVLVHRQRLIKNTRKDGEETGWLNQLRKDGRIEARAIPQATNTGRYRHSGVVNVPNANAIYGPDIRSLFIARDGYSLVGVDAKALEARVFAHFMLKYKGGEELADLILNGDVHAENASIWNCSRNHAKSPYYSLLYGAQIPKFSDTLGVDYVTGEAYYNAFWERYAPLAALKSDLEKAWEARGGKNGGFLKGIDGRKLFARSPHALVNLMFQSTGSLIVKLATVLTDKWCDKMHLDSSQVLHMHDEFQRETLDKHTDLVCEVAKKAFTEAGHYFKINVPIEGDAKVGKNWYETH